MPKLDELHAIACDNDTAPEKIAEMLEEKLCELIPTFHHNRG